MSRIDFYMCLVAAVLIIPNIVRYYSYREYKKRKDVCQCRQK